MLRQMPMHIAERLLLESNSFEDYIDTENLKSYISPGTDQISAELIQAGGCTLRSVIHKFINSNWNMEDLPQQWKEYITVPT
jgi:hypothetical protein